MKRKWIIAALFVGIGLMARAWAQEEEGRQSDFRRSPKMRLSMLIRNLGELEKGDKARLTQQQAKQIVALVKPWEKKPKMGDEDAKGLLKRINAVLTTKQKNEIDRIAAQSRRPSGRGKGGRSGRNNGGKAPNPQQSQQFRQQMQSMQGFFKQYNPFYPPTSYKELKSVSTQMRENFTKRYKARKEILSRLQKKANGK